jgi:hypothetical protein
VKITSQENGNRTGMQSAGALQQMLQGTREFGPTSRGSADDLAAERIEQAKLGFVVGSLPAGQDGRLLDKLGARLQFERTGTRLYEALISKLDAYGPFAGGPTREQLVEIRDQEHHHALLAQELIDGLGGDPTIVTPSANLESVAGHGLLCVLVDPRTTLIQCLEPILIAELADHESWERLVTLVEAGAKRQLAPQVRAAQKTEDEHLAKVRGWIMAAQKA